MGKPRIMYSVGDRFGEWVVINPIPQKCGYGCYSWECQCSCGVIRYVINTDLKGGQSKSCGCRRSLNRSPVIMYSVGDKFGGWTVINPIPRLNKNHHSWQCQCSCGKIRYVVNTVLKFGRSLNCGCKKSLARGTDIMYSVGDKFGEWTIINSKPHRLSDRCQYYWQCQCSCGIIRYVLNSRLKHGRSTRCGSKCGVYILKGVGKLSAWYYGSLRWGAKKRNYTFEVSMEYVASLFNGQCALSGVEIDMHIRSKKHTASLDRIDNTKGYVVGNVQWVHKDVNRLKNKFSQQYFIEMCKKIAKNNV